MKLDDLGLHLGRRQGAGASARLMRGAGSAILKAAPFLMRFLSVAGTAAMFLVNRSGSISMAYAYGTPPQLVADDIRQLAR